MGFSFNVNVLCVCVYEGKCRSVCIRFPVSVYISANLNREAKLTGESRCVIKLQLFKLRHICFASVVNEQGQHYHQLPQQQQEQFHHTVGFIKIAMIEGSII